MGNQAEDIDFVRNQGLKVYDNNEPSPGNGPLSIQQPNDADLKEGQEWEWDYIDDCVITGAVNVSPKFQDGWQPKYKSPIQIFFKPVPWDIFLTVIINKTLIAITDEKRPSLMQGKFICCVSLWILITAVSSYSINRYWSNQELDESQNLRP